MAEPKHPQGGGAVTPQTEGGDHPRGVESENPLREQQDQPGTDEPRKGAHVFPEGVEPTPDARRNPGIASSGGTADSGVPGLDERDGEAS